MKALFFMLHTGYARNFEFGIRLLAERGHSVHIACDRIKPIGADPVEPLVEKYASITTGLSPTVDEKDGWLETGRRLRAVADYLRYLDPEFEGAPALRARAARRIPSGMRQAANLRIARTYGLRERAKDAVARANRELPVEPRFREFIESQAPDVVLVTPLVELGSPQTEYLRAAQDLGIPTGLCVASWDNLTNKGLIHLAPDLVMVWNEAQQREAVELHGISPERVAVTGAEPYDHWFDWPAPQERTEFCGRLGLDPARPIILYVGSSGFIAPNEGRHVARWAREIRWARPELADTQILVRPHPTNPVLGDDEARARLESIDDLVVYPPTGANPTDAESRTDYFNSIWHAAVVTGVNTTAFLESAIIDRPVNVLLVPEYFHTQQGTLHFHYLLPENGGMLKVSATMEDHAESLVDALENGSADHANRHFVSHFIRPHGVERPVAPIFADTIEGLAGRALSEASYTRAGSRTPLTRLEGRAIAGAMRRYLRRRVAEARKEKHRADELKRTASEVKKAASTKTSKKTAKATGKEKTSSKAGDAAAAAISTKKAPKKLEKGLARQKTSSKGEPAAGAGASAIELAQMGQERIVRGARARLEQIAKGDQPIIAGPFLGEVGFEVLYWIPFLRWAVTEYPALRERLVIVARGGTHNWYEGLSSRYYDVLSESSPEELVARREQLKQRTIGSFERELCNRAARELDLGTYGLLHPGLMFNVYYKSIKLDSRAFSGAVQYDGDDIQGLAARYARWPKPDIGPLEGVLPDDFVTVRFYARPSLPDTDENRAKIRSIISSLGEHTNVVLLNNGLELDEHRDFAIDGAVTLAEHMQPEDNLGIQSIAISRSRAFVGTYGGLAYVAPHYGVPSLSFLSDPNEPMPWHLELAQRVFAGPEWGSVTALPLEQLSVLQLVGSTNGKAPIPEEVTA